MHRYSKGWFVKELRAKGFLVHPQLKTHLGLFKESELRNLYYRYVDKQPINPEQT